MRTPQPSEPSQLRSDRLVHSHLTLGIVGTSSVEICPLHLSEYAPIPDHTKGFKLFEVAVADLQPTQMCVGMAEVWNRQRDFRDETPEERRRYLNRKPVPLVRNQLGHLWMVDRHHRLRALLELVPTIKTYGYVIDDLTSDTREEALQALQKKGWLYLQDGRGNGPWQAKDLPATLLGLQDDPYRSLVWKLKQEGVIKPQPLIPYHEFRWGLWLRTRPLPPFSSKHLDPALPAARRLARSSAASHLAGWKGGDA